MHVTLSSGISGTPLALVAKANLEEEFPDRKKFMLLIHWQHHHPVRLINGQAAGFKRSVETIDGISVGRRKC